MKRLLLLIGAGALVLSSCNNQKLEQAREAATLDSLTIESLTAQKDSLMSLVGDINNNLLEINELENIVTSKDFQAESPSQKREVLNNLANIKRELAERRKKLEDLEAKLKKNNGYTANLKKTIDTQKQLIEEQNSKITMLEGELAKANVKIEGLSVQVDSLNTQVETVSQAKNEAEARSVELTDQLNACYYVVATNKELKAMQIIEKKFLGRTKVMEGDFDRSAFVKTDRRTLTEIKTNSKSAQVKTKQPANSYEIVDVDGLKTIKILNPDLFWEKSDFLVIEVK